MVNGMDIHYAVAGEGPSIVFLHGLGASCVTWQENIAPPVGAVHGVHA